MLLSQRTKYYCIVLSMAYNFHLQQALTDYDQLITDPTGCPMVAEMTL